jgi:exodeoxyribonuclease VII small subunit
VAKSELSFEAALKELEKVVARLEGPDLTLTSALEQFEKGVALMKTCDSQLKSAEGKLKELLAGKNGEFIEKILGVSDGDAATGETADD